MTLNNSLEFIKWYFDKEENFFITILNNKTNKISNYLHNSITFEKYYKTIMYHNEINSLYFTFNTFGTDKKKVKENVKNIKSIIFDFDEIETSETDLKYLLKNFPKPSYILQSSPKKYQVCYLLNDIPNNIIFNDFEVMLKTFSKYFNSDKNVCSIEKLFRLPFSINRKNDYKTELVKFNDYKTDYKDFLNFYEDMAAKNEDIRDFIQNEKNKKTEKTPKKTITTKTTQKTDKNVNSYDLPPFKETYIKLEGKTIGMYKSMYKNNDNDCSKTDIQYIKRRKKENVSYPTIMNEIIGHRRMLGKPIKRDFQEYYKERYISFFK